MFFLILTVQKQDALVLLRAVGARRRDVVLPVLGQVLGVTVGGALLGALAAAQATFGAALDPAAALRTVATVGTLGVLASLGALRRVLAVDPIEATTGGGL